MNAGLERVIDLPARLQEQAQLRLPHTDYGLAERLVLRHGQDVRHVQGVGWYAWDGRRWRRDDNGALMRFAKATVRDLREQAARLSDEKEREALWAFARKSEQRRNLEAAIALAASEAPVLARTEDLDSDPHLFNVTNGTLDLRINELRPHAREDLITKMADVEHIEGAECPHWRAFLTRIFGGDEDLMLFVQKLSGYCLCGDTSEQLLPILHGTGANGKSVLTETLLTLAGDYGAAVDPQTFTANNGQGIPNDLARLRGARIVKTVETEEGARLARALIKRITGQDKIAARFLYQEWFEFKPQFKLIVVTNHLPDIPGEDRATWRRIRLVPFKVTIPHAEQDRRLLDKLQMELPGILNWAAKGALLQRKDGLEIAASVGEATRSYMDDSDSIGAFLKERCAREPGAVTIFGVLHRAYLQWAAANDVPHPAQGPAFGRSLTDRGIATRKTTNGTRVRQDLRLL